VDVILVVDTDIEVHTQQMVEWHNLGIDSLRVDTMCDAITWLKRGEQFIFVAISEDTIPDFMLHLQVMRDLTYIPIFIFSRNYDPERKWMSQRLGADDYFSFSEEAKQNILHLLGALNVRERWSNAPHQSPPVLSGGDIVISMRRQLVLVDGKPIDLTKTEFDILAYLMSNYGIVLSYNQIFHHVWSNDTVVSPNEAIWTHVKRLRRKLSKASTHSKHLIENVPGSGYRFCE
jgi:two-component system response regulator VanR